jgi:hypothetical protein
MLYICEICVVICELYSLLLELELFKKKYCNSKPRVSEASAHSFGRVWILKLWRRFRLAARASIEGRTTDAVSKGKSSTKNYLLLYTTGQEGIRGKFQRRASISPQRQQLQLRSESLYQAQSISKTLRDDCPYRGRSLHR